MSNIENQPLQSPNFYELQSRFDEMRAGTAQDAATTIAKHLGVTTFPIHLENIATNYFGCNVAYVKKQEADGLLFGPLFGRYDIFLKNDLANDPVERDMTLAHEFGHFVHTQLGLRDLATEEEGENYADEFASYFLYPE